MLRVWVGRQGSSRACDLQDRGVKWHNHFGKEVWSDFRSHLRGDPAIFQEVSQRQESVCPHKDWYMVNQRSFTCKSPKLETYHIPIPGRMDKQSVVQTLTKDCQPSMNGQAIHTIWMASNNYAEKRSQTKQ